MEDLLTVWALCPKMGRWICEKTSQILGAFAFDDYIFFAQGQPVLHHLFSEERLLGERLRWQASPLFANAWMVLAAA